MLESNDTARVWLALASLAVSLFTLTILAMIFLLLKQAVQEVLKPKSPAAVAPLPTSAAALVAAKKAEVAERKPGRSCGHCGVRLKGDPIREVAFDENSYLVYACPTCKKETLLPK